VESIIPPEADAGFPYQYLVLIEGEYGPIHFEMDYYTYVLGEEIQVGDTITGYFLAARPARLIFPPRFHAQLIVNGEFNNVFIDRFNDYFYEERLEGELISADNSLKLDIGEDTEIYFQDGEPFKGELYELNNRLLVVVYDISTRSIPAITTPNRIVILFEMFVTLPDFAELPSDWLFELPIDELPVDSDDIFYQDTGYDWSSPWEQYDIIVNGRGLPGVQPITVGDYIFPTHVPLRAVLDALDVDISWDNALQQITFEGLKGPISFVAGSAQFTVAGEIITLNQLSVVVNDRTYVPLSFFREIFGMNNAYFEGGHIFIDNAELMQ
jgi:hypothetical protein